MHEHATNRLRTGMASGVGGVGGRVHILCIDPDPAIVDGLTKALVGDPELDIVGCLPVGTNILKHIKTRKADILLIDPDAPGTPKLTELFQSLEGVLVRTVVHTTRSDKGLAKRVVEMGAYGFVVKGPGTAAVILAIREVVEGRLVRIEQRAQVDTPLFRPRPVHSLGTLADG